MTSFNQSRYEQKNLNFLFDSLYCSEEHCEEISDNDGGNENPLFPLFSDQDFSWENDELISLFSKEEENQLFEHLGTNPCLALACRESVEWILKVNARHDFSVLTVIFAVNYFQRFLAGFEFQREKPWMTQLAAVACLSLAAKVEETDVPLLLDLQVEDSKYVFEAKTIQRMEILVLSTLQWKMNPVTPLSFIDYIVRRIGLKEQSLCFEFLTNCERILHSVIRDFRFMCYLPSVIATATMLHVINGVDDSCFRLEYESLILEILGIEKYKVEECLKLIMEMESGRIGIQSNKRKYGSVPNSPNGVMDIFSWTPTPSVPSSPEPQSKKMKPQGQLLQTLKNAAADVLSILPR